MICQHCDKAEVRPGRECAWCGRVAEVPWWDGYAGLRAIRFAQVASGVRSSVDGLLALKTDPHAAAVHFGLAHLAHQLGAFARLWLWLGDEL